MEIYKTIKGYDNRYKISNYGNVLSINYLNRGVAKILKPLPAGKDYLRVNLYKDKIYKSSYIHRLVAQYFIGEIKKGYEINHIDKNKSNNNVKNLEIITHRENSCHKYINGNKICKYIGVTFNKNAKKWVAAIKLNSKRKHLGYFDNPELAFESRKKAENDLKISNKYHFCE